MTAFHQSSLMNSILKRELFQRNIFLPQVMNGGNGIQSLRSGVTFVSTVLVNNYFKQAKNLKSKTALSQGKNPSSLMILDQLEAKLRDQNQQGAFDLKRRNPLDPTRRNP